MAETLYGSFGDVGSAESAVGALLDRGVPQSCISIVLSEEFHRRWRTAEDPELAYTQQTVLAGEAGHTGRFDPLGNDLRNSGEVWVLGGEIGPRCEAPIPPNPEIELRERLNRAQRDGESAGFPAEASEDRDLFVCWDEGPPIYDPERAAKWGLTTTTGQDAAVGAAKGAGIGFGLGVLASLVALAVPGVGIVLGGGALAAGIGALVATTGGGAVAGAVYGYLRDQGVPAETVARMEGTNGIAFVAVESCSGPTREDITEVLRKYGAQAVDRFGYVA